MFRRREVNTGPLQGDKSRTSEKVETTLSEEPQVVIKHGKAAAVLLHGLQWDALQMASSRRLREVLVRATGPSAVSEPARGSLKLRRV